jgi:hypothetical protein
MTALPPAVGIRLSNGARSRGNTPRWGMCVYATDRWFAQRVLLSSHFFFLNFCGVARPHTATGCELLHVRTHATNASRFAPFFGRIQERSDVCIAANTTSRHANVGCEFEPGVRESLPRFCLACGPLATLSGRGVRYVRCALLEPLLAAAILCYARAA